MKRNLINKLVLGTMLSTMIMIPSMNTISAYATPNDNQSLSVVDNQQNNIEKLNSIQDNIQKLDNEIEKSMFKVDSLKKDMEKTEEEIKTIDKDIEKNETELINQKNIMNERLRAVYKRDFFNNVFLKYLDILLSGKNFSEIITQITNVKKMSEIDNNLMKSIKDKELSLKKEKEDLVSKKEKIVSDKKEVEDTIKKQEELKVKQKELLDKTILDIANEQKLKEEELKRIAETKEKLLKEQIPIINSKNEKCNDKVIEVLKESYKYLGVPYVWGGTTPNGFDCSGYMQYIFNKIGVSLPRVSEEQQTVGLPVANNDLQPGDLIFWGYPAHHVGMYIGNGKYIQAPHTGDVIKISTLGSYTNAKRVL